jgi:hypothetical protein
MTLKTNRQRLWFEQRAPFAAILVAVSAVVVLAIACLVDPAGAMRALLFAWLLWLGIAMGSAVWLAIHGATGGRWGDAPRPLLSRLSKDVPILALLFVGLALGARQLYPWTSDASSSVRTTVTALYLNWPGFVLRGGLILALWWWVSTVVSAPRPARVFWSSVCLALYGLSVSIAAVDWSMSLAAPWASTAFPAQFALTQLTSALAVLAILRPAGSSQETSTLAQLLLACVLGLTYFGFMQFLVIWSGNLPDKVTWYVTRGGAWRVVIAAAFVIGAALPFLLLLPTRARANAHALRLAGCAVFVGVALLDMWQIGPGIGASWWLLPIAAVAVAALCFLASRPASTSSAVSVQHGA